MRYDDVAELLPARSTPIEPVEPAGAAHVEWCLRCQAELARYRRMLRGARSSSVRSYLEPAPGLLADTLAASPRPSEGAGPALILTGRRLAYAGAIGGRRPRPAATAAAVIARARRRIAPPEPRSTPRRGAGGRAAESRCYPVASGPSPGQAGGQ